MKVGAEESKRMCVATLLLVALLSTGAHSVLVCPRFTNIALAQQPILAGNDCSNENPLPGTCDLMSGFGVRCVTIDVFTGNTTTSAIPSGLLCASTECVDISGASCSCAGAKLCIRVVAGAQAPFTCVDNGLPATTASPTTTTATQPTTAAPPVNFCDEDDDFDVDCSSPKDNTVVFLIVFFAAIASLIACAACLNLRGQRGARP